MSLAMMEYWPSNIDLEGDGGWEVVLLLTWRLQQGEPDDDLSPVLRPAQLAPVAGVGDLCTLAGCEVEGEGLVVEPASASGLETARLEEDLLHSEISDVTRLSHLTSYNKYLYICSNLSINQYFREIELNRGDKMKRPSLSSATFAPPVKEVNNNNTAKSLLR